MAGIILLAGYLAAGKSTFSKKLSDALNVPCVNKDTVKELLSDRIGFTNRAQNKALSLAAMDMMAHMTEALCMRGVPIIVESNFHADEAALYETIAARHDAPILTFLFTGDVAAHYARFTARLSSPDRHETHKSDPFDTLASFRAYEEELGTFRAGQVVHVDTTDLGQLDADALIDKARAFLASGQNR